MNINDQFNFPGLPLHLCKITAFKGDNLIRFESDHDWRGKLPIKLVQKYLLEKEDVE